MTFPAKFKSVHLFVMGFTQHNGYLTGQEKNWRGVRGVFSPLDWIYGCLEWKADPEHVAARIDRNAEPNAHVNVYAYSWGAGWFYPRFNEAMSNRGRRLANVVLIDPVYRSKLLPFRFRSMLNRVWEPTIEVPGMVPRRIEVYRQTRDKPQGHKVKFASTDGGVVVHHSPYTDIGHVGMDDRPEIHTRCRELSERIATRPPATETSQ